MKVDNVWPDWKVEKIIGQGSYGTVYKCMCSNNEGVQYSAIKVISIPKYDDEYEFSDTDVDSKEVYKEIVEEFSKEIKILESLKGCKNIVSIEDSKIIEKEDGIGWQIFIRMELLTDFNTYTANKEMKPEDIFKLGTDLCEALKVCKEKKIIHRDIKPENIFVDTDGNFKLGDFGVAKQLEKTEMSLSRKGTYNYMSPEVFNSKKYDSRADIYSLGLVMYRLFNNNRLPFLDPNKQIVKYSERQEAFEKRIKGERIPPINSINDNVNNMLLRACAYKPEERYKTVEEFEKEINEIKNGKRLKRSLKRIINSKKLIATISAMLVLTILSLTISVGIPLKKADDNAVTLSETEIVRLQETLKYILIFGHYEEKTIGDNLFNNFGDGYDCTSKKATRFAYNTMFGEYGTLFIEELSRLYNFSYDDVSIRVNSDYVDEELVAPQDPKKLIEECNYGYLKIYSATVDEYIKAIFNVNPNHNIITYNEDGNVAAYYYDDNYYFRLFLDDILSFQIDQVAVACDNIYFLVDENKYEIDAYFINDDGDETTDDMINIKIIADLKTVDGNEVWSIYSIEKR